MTRTAAAAIVAAAVCGLAVAQDTPVGASAPIWLDRFNGITGTNALSTQPIPSDYVRVRIDTCIVTNVTSVVEREVIEILTITIDPEQLSRFGWIGAALEGRQERVMSSKVSGRWKRQEEWVEAE